MCKTLELSSNSVSHSKCDLLEDINTTIIKVAEYFHKALTRTVFIKIPVFSSPGSWLWFFGLVAFKTTQQ